MGFSRGTGSVDYCSWMRVVRVRVRAYMMEKCRLVEVVVWVCA